MDKKPNSSWVHGSRRYQDGEALASRIALVLQEPPMIREVLECDRGAVAFRPDDKDMKLTG